MSAGLGPLCGILVAPLGLSIGSPVGLASTPLNGTPGPAFHPRAPLPAPMSRKKFDAVRPSIPQWKILKISTDPRGLCPRQKILEIESLSQSVLREIRSVTQSKAAMQRNAFNQTALKKKLHSARLGWRGSWTAKTRISRRMRKGKETARCHCEK